MTPELALQYAERLAKAAPDRFQVGYTNPLWDALSAIARNNRQETYSHQEGLWAFWGPLAEERNIRGISETWAHSPTDLSDGHYLTLLESLMDAVCKSFEEEAK